MSTTGSGSDSSSSAQPTGSGSSPDTRPRVSLKSITINGVTYVAIDSVEMLLMDMHLRARNDGERELINDQIDDLRKARHGR